MTLARRVMWKEGMFLRPHHFQQQDLRAESALMARIAQAMPHHWGYATLEIDPGRLEAGQVGLARCAGAFRDGTLFSAPGEAAEIAPLAVSGDAKGVTVHLVAPSRTPGAPLGANDAPGRVNPARYAIREEDLADLLREGLETQPVELGLLNLRLVAGDAPEGFDALPVARVIEVSQGRVKLDPDFIPPVLHAAASPWLTRTIGELAARFDARAAQLAGPLGSAGGLSAGANRELMLLRVCNAKAALLAQFEAAKGVHHPETLYRALVEAAADLCTFTERDTRRPPPAPAYDHDDLQGCFGPLVATIQAALGNLDEPEARPIPLEFHAKRRIHYNRSVDPTLLENARVYLVGSAAMPDEEFRASLPGNISIGSTGEIFEIMSAASSSARIRPMPHYPPELRQMAGWVCFEIDQNAPAWRGVRDQRSIAIHVQDVFRDLKLQLWAVRD